MNDKFKNKYRIETTRLKGWDYGKNSYYFVTICTKDRIPYFGNVINGMVQLSEIGKIAFDELQKTSEIRKDMNVTLGEFVIMPNHIHCIIIIGENEYNTNRRDAMRCVSTNIAIRGDECRDAMRCDNNCRDAMHGVSTNKFGPQSKNLPSIIRGFKSAVTKRAKIINPDFSWQPNYYEHIIRDEKSFEKISEYIINNPLKWNEDKYYER
jgi:REP element-mobilizing transposase RayT